NIQKNAIIYVSISFDSQLLEVYSFGRKKVGNSFSGGFVREDMKRGLFKNADCVIYSLTVTERQLKKLKRYIFAMERSKEIYRYHFWFVRVSCKYTYSKKKCLLLFTICRDDIKEISSY